MKPYKLALKNICEHLGKTFKKIFKTREIRVSYGKKNSSIFKCVVLLFF